MRKIVILGICVLFFTFVKTNIALNGRVGIEKNADQGVLGSGIVFFNTPRLDEIKDFYIHRIGCKMWIDQGNCAILKYGNLLVGFCSGEKIEPDAVITFFYKSKEEVDTQYQKFKAQATAPPKENRKYRIYHFYTHDPDGRSIEFQHFTHPIDWDFGKY